MNQKENEQMWLERVTDFKNSGKTQLMWCKEKQLKLSSLRYWLRKTRESSDSTSIPEWFELNISEGAANSMDLGNCAIKVLVGQFKVEVNEGFDPAVFLKVVKVLQGI